MEAINQAFLGSNDQRRAVLVTNVTAGFPDMNQTLDNLLAMQAGGADIIMLGVPSNEPMTNNPGIERANAKAFQSFVRLPAILQMIVSARRQGLTVPVLLTGSRKLVYQSPFGEDKLLRDIKGAGVDGFAITDMPHKNTKRFSNSCKAKGLSYIPVIYPSPPDNILKEFCSSVSSFVYVSSYMAVDAAEGDVRKAVGDVIDRIYDQIGERVPTVVSCDIRTHQHFVEASSISDGVAIDSSIVSILEEATAGTGALKLKEHCLKVAGRAEAHIVIPIRQRVPQLITPTRVYLSDGANDSPDGPDEQVKRASDAKARFGAFGGQYVPKSLVPCLTELEEAWNSINNDPSFWTELDDERTFTRERIGLHPADRLTEEIGGARIWLKREDLNLNQNYKINNAIGQIVFAHRLGKTSIVAESRSGQHGLAVASACARFDMQSTIYMGSEDFEREAEIVFMMRIIGANVISVPGASGDKGTLRDATSQAFQTWMKDSESTHFAMGSVAGPYPFPTIVRSFCSVIGNEIRAQFVSQVGKLPDAVVACVDDPPAAAGLFYPFLHDADVALFGAEGYQRDAPVEIPFENSQPSPRPHGLRLIQNARENRLNGMETGFDSEELEFPGLGPELSSWKDSGRVKFVPVDNADSVGAASLLCEKEGIFPSIESARGLVAGIMLAAKLGTDKDLVVCIGA